jgi:hypothetical protein
LTKLVQDVADFVMTYGPLAWLGTREELEQSLHWYLSRDRALLLKDRDQLVGVFLAHIVSDLSPWTRKRKAWPLEDPEGTYAFIQVAVLHPLYRDRGLVGGLRRWLHEHFPTVTHLAFERADKNLDMHLHVQPLKELMSDGRRREATRTTPTAAATAATRHYGA